MRLEVVVGQTGEQDVDPLGGREVSIDDDQPLIVDPARPAPHVIPDLAQQGFLSYLDPDANRELLQLLTQGFVPTSHGANS